MKNLENTPKIYVGTYGMYSNGSLFGEWINLTDYSDREEFYKACYEYHRNEFLPELMFQDWEFVPDFLISKSWLHEDTYKYFEAIAEMSSDGAEAFELYCNNITSWPGNGMYFDELLENLNECYQGYFGGAVKDAKIEFTYRYNEDTGMLSGVPEMLERYFDYEAYRRYLFVEGYTEYDGQVFLDQ
ncbi:antirestriction protein ArdA [Dyadobacter sp. 32]|uniref:antirestriction protein ArdA n=1 Tax=Dyadobacter sp. 32 TaxID=538966 RepID=UPI0011EEB441